MTKKSDGEVDVFATNAHQLQEAQFALVDWAERKRQEMCAEAEELNAELQIAKKNKWRTNGLKRQLKKTLRHVVYYKKFKAALEEGYTPFPPVPGVGVFAVRTSKEEPTIYARWSEERSNRPWDLDEPAEIELDVGEGDYVDPAPEHYVLDQSVHDRDTGELLRPSFQWRNQALQSPMFPVKMAKPELMKATSRAMALKIFDEIGVLPSETPKGRAQTRDRRQLVRSGSMRGDPILVGRLLDPRGTKRNPKVMNFIIGWRLDTSTL